MIPKIACTGSPLNMSESLHNLPKNDTKIWQPPENRTLPNLKPLKMPAYLNCDEGDEGRNINKRPVYLNCNEVDEGRNINMRSSGVL